MPDTSAPSTIDTAHPVELLLKETTPAEHALAEQVGLSDGHGVPFRMFAKVVFLVHTLARWASPIDGISRRLRGWAKAAVAAAAVNVATFGAWYIHRVETNATAAERAAELERRVLEYRDAVREEIKDLRLDLREMRTELRRMSGAELRQPDSDQDIWRRHDQPLPDKLSFLLRKGPTCSLAPVTLAPPSL